MRKIIIGTVTAMLLAATASAQAQVDVLERGRELNRGFLQGEHAAVVAELSEQLATEVGGEEGLQALHEQVTAQLGEEQAVISEEVLEPPELPGGGVYLRTSRFTSFGGAVVSEWAFDQSGTVVGFQIRPGADVSEAPSSHLDHQTEADLRLPFDGEWTVVWGGRSVEQNYHAAYRDQRFAYDFLVLDGDASFRGEGSENEDYFCFALPVLAPADGTVVAVEGSVPDNVPGEFTDDDPLGNHVIIDHGTGEFSFLAHLKEGSPTVAVGAAVAAGEKVGECGNSGRSSEPHLHYHLQDSAEFGAGDGLPAQFNDYLADGEPVERGEPEQGQRIVRGDATAR